jgi:hypothetical protein
MDKTSGHENIGILVHCHCFFSGLDRADCISHTSGVIYDSTGSYRVAFLLFLSMSLAAACAIPFARLPGSQSETK